MAFFALNLFTFAATRPKRPAMLSVWKDHQTIINEPDSIDPRSAWINVANPSLDEIKLINKEMKIPGELIKDVLDVDETSRSEVDGRWLFIIYRIPIYNTENQETPYQTVPLGIFISRENIVTICARDNEVMEDFLEGRQKQFDPNNKFRFVLQIFLRTATYYLRYLKRINKLTEQMENELIGSVRNRELIRMLRLEKSLVYFTTSLKANQLLLEKLQRSRFAKLAQEDLDEMEDVLIETQQAIEMTNVYTKTLANLMETFSSIISNNFNVILKILTSITIILMLPTLVASVYGMNIDLPFQHSPHAFLIIVLISLALAGIGIFVFRRKDFF